MVSLGFVAAYEGTGTEPGDFLHLGYSESPMTCLTFQRAILERALPEGHTESIESILKLGCDLLIVAGEGATFGSLNRLYDDIRGYRAVKRIKSVTYNERSAPHDATEFCITVSGKQYSVFINPPHMMSEIMQDGFCRAFQEADIFNVSFFRAGNNAFNRIIVNEALDLVRDPHFLDHAGRLLSDDVIGDPFSNEAEKMYCIIFESEKDQKIFNARLQARVAIESQLDQCEKTADLANLLHALKE